jgi:cytoskeleton protein RodZ
VSDKNDKQEQESEDETQAPLAGERLAHARREQQITVLEIAKELHLDEYKVRALESNDFEVIGAPVFAKGHLKKYAQILKVDDATLMGEYYELTRAQAGQPPLSVRAKQRRAIAPGPWLAVIAAVIIIATAYWWLAVREPVADAVVVGQVRPLPEEPTTTEPDEPATEMPSATLEEEPAVEVTPEVETPEPEPEPEPVIAAAANITDTRLSITYSGDSWTEISDAKGRRLFFDLGKAGRTVNLSGEAPFNVLFGDAANVSLQLNDAAFELPRADRRGTVRLTILSP